MKSPTTICARLAIRGVIVLISVAASGCGTTINRVATEQLLLSDAIDSAICQISFDHLSGQKVYLDTTYIRSDKTKTQNLIDADYVISALRQQITVAGGLLQQNRKDADIVLEPRIGALGTNGHEVVYGIPQGASLATAASAVSNSPLPAIPELAVGKNHAQSGIAKIAVFAYDQATGQPLWQSGIAKSESTSENTWVLGAGPFQKGSVYEGIRFAGRKLAGEQDSHDATQLADSYQRERVFSHPEATNGVRQASNEEENVVR